VNIPFLKKKIAIVLWRVNELEQFQGDEVLRLAVRKLRLQIRIKNLRQKLAELKHQEYRAWRLEELVEESYRNRGTYKKGEDS